MNTWEQHIPEDLIDAFLDKLFTDEFHCSPYDFKKGLEDYAYSGIRFHCDYDECVHIDRLYIEADEKNNILDEYEDEISELKSELKKHGMKMKFLKNNSVLFCMEEEE
jgi:hypothetical protein